MNRFKCLKIKYLYFVIICCSFLSTSIVYSDSLEISVNNSRFIIGSDKNVSASIFTLENPSRLVIDIKNINKIIKNNIDYKIVKDIRASRKEEVSRLVFDLNVKPKNLLVNKVKDLVKNKSNIVIDLNYKDKLISLKQNITIVIDPGHGGADPGAVRGNIKEKQINLKASKILKNKLEENGFNVVMTRSNDTFVSLRSRVRFARKHAGDLFISLHADATKNKKTRGTSIYSLSEKASDKLAKDLAERENKADLIGGVDFENFDDDVSEILIDLSRRETKNSSIEFAELFVVILEKNDIKLLRRPHRQAGFAVLKAPDIPSVLIEMGFISNNSDLKKLSDTKHLRRLMHQVSRVVDKYFIDNPK